MKPPLIALVLIVLSTQVGYSQAMEPILDRRIEAGQIEMISKIKQSKDWRNPWIMINEDEVVLSWFVPGKDRSFPQDKESKTLKCEDLDSALRALPCSAWPYGRIVSVQERAIQSSDKLADQFRKHAWATTKAVFKRLDIVMNPWPAA